MKHTSVYLTNINACTHVYDKKLYTLHKLNIICTYKSATHITKDVQRTQMFDVVIVQFERRMLHGERLVKVGMTGLYTCHIAMVEDVALGHQ